jgi:hypothetical protein
MMTDMPSIPELTDLKLHEMASKPKDAEKANAKRLRLLVEAAELERKAEEVRKLAEDEVLRKLCN